MQIDLTEEDLAQARQNKQQFIDHIIYRVTTETLTPSDYALETMRRVLEEEL